MHVKFVSISKILKQAWSLGGDAKALELINPNSKHQTEFNINILTPNGTLFAIYVKYTQEEVANVAPINDKGTKQVKMSVQQAHEKMGHINERATKEIAKNLGWLPTDNQPLNCAACVAGKAKQKSLKKVGILDPDDEKDGY